MPKVKFYIANLDQISGVLCWTVADNYFDNKAETIEMYPELEGKMALTKTNEERYDIFESLLAPNYNKHIKSNENIYDSYIKTWNQYNDKYMNAMGKYFNMKWPNKDEEFQALVADLPIFPRNVEDHSFYVTGYGSLIDYCKKHTQIDIKNKKEVDKVFKDKF